MTKGPHFPFDISRGRRKFNEILESVFGPEDRQIVRDSSHLPFSALCSIIDPRPGTSSVYSTGFLVGPQLVVTAGHVVDDDGYRPTALKIAAGATPDGAPFGARQVGQDRIECFSDWRTRHDPDDDLAVIRLSAPFAPDPGVLPLAALNDAELADATVLIAGYPICLGQGCEDDTGNEIMAIRRGKQLYQHRQRVENQTDTQIYHRIDTWKGQSGAPLILNGTVPYSVIGVHCRGPRSNWPDPLARLHNAAVRLTSDKINWIRQFL